MKNNNSSSNNNNSTKQNSSMKANNTVNAAIRGSSAAGKQHNKAASTPLVGEKVSIGVFWGKKRGKNGALPGGYGALATEHPELKGYRSTRGELNSSMT